MSEEAKNTTTPEATDKDDSKVEEVSVESLEPKKESAEPTIKTAEKGTESENSTPNEPEQETVTIYGKKYPVKNGKRPFVHLHLHTEFSLLDGAARINYGKKHPIIDALKAKNMPGVAITDHGNMYGAFTLYKLCRQNGLKPIVGCEFYTVEDMHKKAGREERNHLVLIAKNDKGYKNLVKLNSLAFCEGFHYKPRIDLALLKEHSEGLICLSACLAGAIPQYILHGEYEKAKEYALNLQSMFDEGDFYIEIQNHGIEDEVRVLPYLAKLSREIGAKLVATNDVHYLEKDDAEMHDVLLCVQTGKTYDDPNRMRFEGTEFYLKDYDEMYALFKDYEEALDTPFEIMEKCDISIKKEELMPPYKPADGSTPAEYLRKIAYEGLVDRYGEITDAIRERAEYELGIIIRMGFAEYYLIVWDFIDFARKHDIPVGKGRGSGVSSIIAYAIGITDVEPLQYNLLFERFLNPERVSNPDFDIDFCYEGRGRVKEYVVEKYGKDRVCEIITFGTMACKAAIKDVARVYNVPFDIVNKITKLIPAGKITLAGVIGEGKPEEAVPELIEMYNSDPVIKKVLDMAKKLEGMPRQTGKHAAGVVICKEIISDFVPLQTNGDDVTTQYQKDEVEELGMLKMDFLGLTTLTDVKKAKQYIKETTGKIVDFKELGYADPEVFKLLSSGETDAVFQLESAGMKKFMKELQPNSVEDIIAGISLFRPGPIDSIPKYIAAKNNPETITYAHPMLEHILDITYGCIVYQEQVMQIVRELGGYTFGRADLLRRAMSKKKKDVMLAEKDIFLHGCEHKDAVKDARGLIITPEVKAVEGCIKRGVPAEVGSAIFDEMESFASYAFNKSHAAAYGVLAYETAYFKRYYPVQFITAVINDRITKSDEVAKYVQYLKDTGYKVLPPNINRSYAEFRCEKDETGEVCIRFGLCGIKNVGENVIKEATKIRDENGEFKSFADFVKRTISTGINKKTIESLVVAGAFDTLGDNRATCVASIENLVNVYSHDKKKQAVGQTSIFDLFDDIETPEEELVRMPEYDSQRLLSMEKEVLNVYMSGHPLASYREAYKSMPFNLSLIQDALGDSDGDDGEDDDTSGMVGNDVLKEYDNKSIELGCMIQSFKRMPTKGGKVMGVGKVEDLYASIDVVFFPRVYEKYKAILETDNIVKIRGRIDTGDRVQINVQDVELWRLDDEDRAETSAPSEPLEKSDDRLYLNFEGVSDDNIHRALRVLDSYAGNTTVYCQRNRHLEDPGKKVTVSNHLIWELSAIIGEKSIKYVEDVNAKKR